MGTTQGVECYCSEGTLANNHHDSQSWWGWTLPVQVGGLYSTGTPAIWMLPEMECTTLCPESRFTNSYSDGWALQWWTYFTQTDRLQFTQNLFLKWCIPSWWPLALGMLTLSSPPHCVCSYKRCYLGYKICPIAPVFSGQAVPLMFPAVMVFKEASWGGGSHLSLLWTLIIRKRWLEEYRRNGGQPLLVSSFLWFKGLYGVCRKGILKNREPWGLREDP